ncbi:hypothetical protein [Enterococcus sp. HY326]|uniref:hypothetical protein n=1 Tax=Enterococcus sp. HY326 TaxID=2971265 RepID=UPI00223FEEE8|nr:hypothetical protein [Enterococcus sp. HY326]
MTKPLFTNVTSTTATTERVRDFLLDLENITQWAPEISSLQNSEMGMTLTRIGHALNAVEEISVTEADGKIIYHSIGGKLAYDLEFVLEKQQQQTKISQMLHFTEPNYLSIPLSLVKPIIKQAFQENLHRLAAVVQ